MSTYTSITMPFTEAVGAFNALAPHMSKDAGTLVITGVYVTAEGTLVATDRYTVGRYIPTYDTHDFLRPRMVTSDGFDGAILPADAVKFVAKMRATALNGGKFAAQHHAVRLVFDSSEGQVVRVELLSGVNWERYDDAESNTPDVVQSARFELVAGKFPPVERVFPDDTTEFALTANAVSLKTEFLARVDTAVKWLGGRSDTARFQFMKTDNPNKPGPVYVTVFCDVGPAVGKFDSLIQPNLLLR
jgi:hypothetical protein